MPLASAGACRTPVFRTLGVDIAGAAILLVLHLASSHMRNRISNIEEVEMLITPEARADALYTRCIAYTHTELTAWHAAGNGS
ncbi:MAG TPA: hypothetical protein VNT02_09360 [Burkholderiales bacterium]|nr:hypothetical protein [Burkholderiales bacterium]